MPLKRNDTAVPPQSWRPKQGAASERFGLTMSRGSLPFGPLTERTVHLCVDMQNMFALDTPWRVAWLPEVLPAVRQIAERHPHRTVFTRFIPPARMEDATGSWQRYYERWRNLTGECIEPGWIDLVPPLAALVRLPR